MAGWTMDWLNQVFYGNPLSQWALAVVAFAVTFTVLPFLRLFLLSRARKLHGLTEAASIELVLLLIKRTRSLFLFVVALYFAMRFLELPPRLDRISLSVIVFAGWFQAALWAVAAAGFFVEQRKRQAAGRTGGAPENAALDIGLFVARVVIFAVAILLALDNIGVNITALVAGLGVGGIAIALAVQTILGDLLASLSIMLDKPFEVGDWLRIDDIDGTVEKIGVKSTRLRSFSGEQIVLSNADMLKCRIRNLGRMPERRSLFVLGVAYETTPEKLQQVPNLVEAAVTGVPGTRFEYCVFRQFGASALEFEVVYYVPDPAGARLKFLKIVDAVNKRIHADFAANGIEFAYPTQTVYVKSATSPRAP
ncbi:MAG: mechanosensitive ion channel family protein [Steroidobacteraceae bacterium]